MAQTDKMQTYQGATEAILNCSMILPSELLVEIEKFIEENKQLGFTTREEFIRDAVRWRLKSLNENCEYIEIPREKYERLEVVIREMGKSYYSTLDFIHKQVDDILEKSDKWFEEKQKYEEEKL